MALLVFISQTSWTKYPDPVIRPTEFWEAFGIGDNALIYEDYTGAGFDLGDTLIRVCIGHAISPDGITWYK